MSSLPCLEQNFKSDQTFSNFDDDREQIITKSTSKEILLTSQIAGYVLFMVNIKEI